MSALQTTIAWTDRSWNPVRGCSRVSTGCEQCYAEKQAGRFSGPGQPYAGLVRKTSQGFKWTGNVTFIEKDLPAPLRWKKPSKIFVNSMSDVFHEAVPDAWIDRIFAVMALAPWHTFQVLTKRPERMQAYVADLTHGRYSRIRLSDAAANQWGTKKEKDVREAVYGEWPLPNVWLGVSCENQMTADERIPWLLKTPAIVRFMSYEPALGPLSQLRRDMLEQLHWVIAGGESGPHARICDVAWLLSMRDECAATGVAFFLKQLGSRPAKMNVIAFPPLHDRKGADPTEWPEDWHVQQFPSTPQHSQLTLMGG